MLDGLFVASLISTCIQAIKEAKQPTIPAENWANKELYHKDLMSDISMEQLFAPSMWAICLSSAILSSCARSKTLSAFIYLLLSKLST